ncbi:MAG: 3-deoxy-manno-octulosonate cytidylyltransferase [Flavobacteriales bacterium]|nr:3-deoxy-manno-octulosonate cytidylyltransferase [Flavobacteriales bacterium]MCX7768273.1 3-deoxy-manno-octulosonate cytidylyltransferase [Flavobacteriales bacterium]MDW8410834.1 3-deoxy-manno-octulosonate cytidylyltransferase [Flavobacteriales bacterium]
MVSLSLPLTVGIIPARYHSSRLPGKVLADIGGKPLLYHVWSRSCQAALHRVVVATDSPTVARVAEDFGAEVVLTGSHHPNGTSRCLEAYEKIDPGRHYEVMVNIQGDEPFLSPEALNALMAFMAKKAEAWVATLCHPAGPDDQPDKESLVKLVTDAQGRVLYFSRALIPHRRSDTLLTPEYKLHVGIYAFRTRWLKDLAALPSTTLEQVECLEQLRWLYHGVPVYALMRTERSFSVDTPEDLEKAREHYLHSR